MHYNYIVIGAGSMGMAAGYYLAHSGHHTLLLDAFNPPHDHASHHGETRLIRYAYGEGIAYVPLALRAGERWRALEMKTNRQLFHETGVINVGRKQSSFVQNVINSAKLHNIPLEVLDAPTVHKRWPGMRLPDDYVACYEPTAGVLKVEDCINAYRQLAIEAGAVIRTNSRVATITPGNVITVTTTAGTTFTADRVIVTVGAWAKALLAQTNLTLPVSPIRKTFAWYEADASLYSEHAHYPGFSFMLDDACFYGFPSIDGAGIKVGRHDGGIPISPDEPRIPFDDTDAVALDQFLDTYMPQVGARKYGKTCMYAMTPDEHFIIDQHPHYPNVTFAAGFSGHGFKFASAVGELLSELATTGQTTQDISMFRLNRFTQKETYR